MKKIGILGGTFNPIHNGHISLAKKALKDFGLKYVVFVPTGLPPHKSSKHLCPKKDRLQMVRLAVDKKKKLKISTIEINRKGYSYAVDTFTKLRKRFGPGCELYYIMGLDSINTILDWKKPIELFRLCRFIIATRPGSKIRTLKRIMKFPPVSFNKEKINLIELNMKISSSAIRDRIKAGRSISRLVPKHIAEYINEKGLYL